MKWSATKNCSRIVPTVEQNEIINAITRPEMTTRPLKKAKYASQVNERNERGLNVSSNPVREDLTGDETSDADPVEAIFLDTMATIGRTPDRSELYFPSSSSCNGSHTLSLNSISGEDPTQMASTSNNAHNFPEDIAENAPASQPSVASNCVCNANKNTAPKQINFALCRWQSKQLAQGIIDNAINKVLGDLGIPPNHSETVNAAFGEPISWGSYLNAHNIENEGVVEAIRQQGLQHKRFVQQPSGSRPDDSSKANIPCESSEETIRNGLGDPSGATFSESAFSAATNLLDNVPGTSFASSYSKKSDITSLLRAQNPIFQSHDLFDDVEALMKPEDLLTTAVSYAISEKGLGVLNVNE